MTKNVHDLRNTFSDESFAFVISHLRCLIFYFLLPDPRLGRWFSTVSIPTGWDYQKLDRQMTDDSQGHSFPEDLFRNLLAIEWMSPSPTKTRRGSGSSMAPMEPPWGVQLSETEFFEVFAAQRVWPIIKENVRNTVYLVYLPSTKLGRINSNLFEFRFFQIWNFEFEFRIRVFQIRHSTKFDSRIWGIEFGRILFW